MPSEIGIGFSKHPDDLVAAQQAIRQVKRQIGLTSVDLVFVFHSVHYNPKVFLPLIYDSLDRTRVLGCSTAALINPEGIEQRGIGIMAIRSAYVKFEIAHMGHLHFQNIFDAGKKLAADCVTGFGTQFRKLFFLLVNGLNPSLPDLIEGLRDQLGQSFPIFGIGSSDDFSFEKTSQLYQNQTFTDGAVGLILGGSFQSGISLKHGWKPLGKPRLVNSTEDNDRHIVKSIDGRPAWKLFEQFFGDEARAMRDYRLSLLNVRYPLGIVPPGESEFLVRNVINTLDDGSIVCQDNIIANSRVHVMLGGKESCLQATEAAASEVKVQMAGKKPDFVLVFESLMRYQLLKRSLKEELAVIKKILGEDVPIFGMFSTNEIFTPRHYLQEKTQTFIQNGSILIMAVI